MFPPSTFYVFCLAFPLLFFVVVFFPFAIFLSSPEEADLHISDFLYELLVSLVFPWEELPVLEVIEHDGDEAHLIIWLEHKKKRCR